MFIYFVLIFQQLIASGTHIIAKVVVKDIDPVSLTMLRSGIAAIGLLILMRIRSVKMKFEKRDLKKILLLSALAIPVNQFLFLYAIKYTTPSNAALLYGTTPAMVLVLSIILGREKIKLKRIAGVALAFIGVLIVIFERGLDFGSDYTMGNIIICIAVIAWALYTVQGKEMIIKYGAFKTSSATMVIGTLIFLPVGAWDTINFQYSSLTFYHWLGLLYLAFMTSIFAYVLWYYALSRIEAPRVTIFMNLQPVLTTLLSVIILGQSITTAFLIGGAVALTGVVIAQTN
ncbi:MAG: EamA family transporter [Ignavibacteriales bacterium]|nr:EamA family transporter [Ignavibacteriales bacterium]